VLMVGGRAVAIGSPIALKNRHGAGWALDVSGARAADVSALLRVAPSARIERVGGARAHSAVAGGGGGGVSDSAADGTTAAPLASGGASESESAEAIVVRIERRAADELYAATRVLEEREVRAWCVGCGYSVVINRVRVRV
jgi:hypothetical protein